MLVCLEVLFGLVAVVLIDLVDLTEVDDLGLVALIDEVVAWAVVGLCVADLLGFLLVVEEIRDLRESRVRSPSIDLFESIVYNYNMKATKITKKQQAVLDFLEDFTEEKGYSPSYREIQAGLGLSSVSAVAEHIDNLVAKGVLRKVPGAARSLEVLDYRHTETVELFRARLLDATDEERAVLLAATEVLGLDLEGGGEVDDSRSDDESAGIEGGVAKDGEAE